MIFSEVEAAIVAPLEGCQIALCMLAIARAKRPCHRALDVAKARVEPSKIGVRRTPSTAGPHDALQTRFGDPVEASEVVAQYAQARCDRAHRIAFDRLFRKSRDGAHLGIDRPSITRLDGNDERVAVD